MFPGSGGWNGVAEFGRRSTHEEGDLELEIHGSGGSVSGCRALDRKRLAARPVNRSARDHDRARSAVVAHR